MHVSLYSSLSEMNHETAIIRLKRTEKRNEKLIFIFMGLNSLVKYLLLHSMLLASWFLNTLIFPESINSNQIKSITFKSKGKPSLLIKTVIDLYFHFLFLNQGLHSQE